MPLYNPAIPEGTAFPTGPANGQRFRRTDRQIEYYYDSTAVRWLSANQHSLPIAMQDVLNPRTTAATDRVPNPWASQYDIYVEQFDYASNNSVASSSLNYFTAQLNAGTTAASTNVGSSLNGQSDTQFAWITHRNQPNAVIGSTNPAFQVSYATTGSPSCHMGSAIVYRLVG